MNIAPTDGTLCKECCDADPNSGCCAGPQDIHYLEGRNAEFNSADCTGTALNYHGWSPVGCSGMSALTCQLNNPGAAHQGACSVFTVGCFSASTLYPNSTNCSGESRHFPPPPALGKCMQLKQPDGTTSSYKITSCTGHGPASPAASGLSAGAGAGIAIGCLSVAAVGGMFFVKNREKTTKKGALLGNEHVTVDGDRA